MHLRAPDKPHICSSAPCSCVQWHGAIPRPAQETALPCERHHFVRANLDAPALLATPTGTFSVRV